MPEMAKAMILDIDGTLVDTNYQHALVWYRAFRRHGVVLPIWRIHRSIGKGGDQLVEALAGRAGVETVAVLSGGCGVAELREAGARKVFESIAQLVAEPEALAR